MLTEKDHGWEKGAWRCFWVPRSITTFFFFGKKPLVGLDIYCHLASIKESIRRQHPGRLDLAVVAALIDEGRSQVLRRKR